MKNTLAAVLLYRTISKSGCAKCVPQCAHKTSRRLGKLILHSLLGTFDVPSLATDCFLSKRMRNKTLVF